MNLGAFSVSLAVKDIHASKAFYEKLGFKEFGGDISQNWLILKNGTHLLGLFQGMFEKNTLTFNPGWDQEAQTLASFLPSTTYERSSDTSPNRASRSRARQTKAAKDLPASWSSIRTAIPSSSISTSKRCQSSEAPARRWMATTASQYCLLSFLHLAGQGRFFHLPQPVLLPLARGIKSVAER